MILRQGVRRPLTLLLLASTASASQNVPATADFHTAIQLVQLNVIAKDKKGNPVADLRRDEFQIFDNGVRQDIRVFIPEIANPEPSSSQRPPTNSFTNHLTTTSGPHSAYSVILIDDLYSGSDPTNEEGSTLSRARALQMLRSIPEGEKIAIYATSGKLRVICEFTSDRDLLERELRKWKPTPTTPAPEARPRLQALVDPPAEGRASAEIARIEQARQAAAGDFEMTTIAEHLAGIPGRKNMIWLSNKFILGPKALQSLARAGVSLYPVDIDGVCRLCPERPVQTMDALAAITGGIAYHGRNDLDVAIREAMDDGRVSYTLGFYPATDEDRIPKPHRLSIKVTRPGIELHYRTTYPTEAPPLAQATTADLVQALNRPVDATAIPINASVTRTDKTLNLEASLGIESLDLIPDQDLWTGKIEVVARFTTSEGVVAIDPFLQTLTLNLTQATYDASQRGGISYRNTFQIPAKAVEMKLLFANPGSGKIGTLTIPLAQLKSKRN